MKKTHSLILVSACLFAVVRCNDVPMSDRKTIWDPIPFTDAPSLSDEDINAAMTAINQARSSSQQCGGISMAAAPSLHWSVPLYRAAAERNQDLMASNIYINDSLDHRGSGTSNDYTKVQQSLDHKSYFAERVENNGYGTDWQRVGENLASHKDLNTSAQVVAEWMDKTKSCKEIMDPRYQDVGLALLDKGDPGHVVHQWVMVLSYKKSSE